MKKKLLTGFAFYDIIWYCTEIGGKTRRDLRKTPWKSEKPFVFFHFDGGCKLCFLCDKSAFPRSSETIAKFFFICQIFSLKIFSAKNFFYLKFFSSFEILFIWSSFHLEFFSFKILLIWGSFHLRFFPFEAFSFEVLPRLRLLHSNFFSFERLFCLKISFVWKTLLLEKLFCLKLSTIFYRNPFVKISF